MEGQEELRPLYIKAIEGMWEKSNIWRLLLFNLTVERINE
jgi:hypothetical protein